MSLKKHGHYSIEARKKARESKIETTRRMNGGAVSPIIPQGKTLSRAGDIYPPTPYYLTANLRDDQLQI
jgi:hypothetical protein